MSCQKYTWYRLSKLTLAAAVWGLLALVSPGYAQVASNGWATKMFSSAGTSLTRNFGDLALHAEAEHHFKFHNIYKENVVIYSAQSSCSCTKVTVPNKVIKSGETGEIVARVDTSGTHIGKRKATVTVRFSKPYSAEVQLQVASHIRNDVVFDPGVIDFGGVTEGENVKKTTYLRYSGPLSNWKVVDLKKNSPSIRAEAKPVTQNGGVKTYQVDVEVLPNAEPGYINDLLQFVTNESGSSSVFVPIHGLVYPTLSVKPSHLQFGVIHPGESITRILVVRGSTPFKITDVVSDDARVQFKTADQDSVVQVIQVTIDIPQGEKIGKFKQNIKIKTTLNETAELEVPAIGIVADQADKNNSEDSVVRTIFTPKYIENAFNEYKNRSEGPVIASFEGIDLQTLISSYNADFSESEDFTQEAERAPITRKFGQNFLEPQKLEIETESADKDEAEQKVDFNLVVEETDSEPVDAADAQSELPQENSLEEMPSSAADADGWFSVEESQQDQQNKNKETRPEKKDPKVASQGVSFKRPNLQ